MSNFYDSERYGVVQQVVMGGNDLTTLLFTPQAGTAAETKTHTTTMKPWFPQRNITLKKIGYIIDTAQTGAGNNLTLNLYNGTTSAATLAVTTQTAGELVESSADMDEDIDSDGYIRFTGLSLTTASDANCAYGQIVVTYQERYA
jgi:hypothetical protein